MSWRSILLQIPAYAAFAAFIGYFSASPPYRQLAPGRALLKLSFVHAGERKEQCRTRSPEELARLAPNMRAQLDCPRERSDVSVQVDMDGARLIEARASASGLRHDLPTTLYRRIEVPAGQHTFSARLADTAQGEFRHRGELALDLQPGRVLVIDFDATRGGFVFVH